MNPGPLHWELGVLASGPLGKSLETLLLEYLVWLHAGSPCLVSRLVQLVPCGIGKVWLHLGSLFSLLICVWGIMGIEIQRRQNRIILAKSFWDSFETWLVSESLIPPPVLASLDSVLFEWRKPKEDYQVLALLQPWPM